MEKAITVSTVITKPYGLGRGINSTLETNWELLATAGVTKDLGCILRYVTTVNL
jgi:hypothetical protein